MRRLILALACAVVLAGAVGCSSTGGLDIGSLDIGSLVTPLAAQGATKLLSDANSDEPNPGEIPKEQIERLGSKLAKRLMAELSKGLEAIAPKD